MSDCTSVSSREELKDWAWDEYNGIFNWDSYSAAVFAGKVLNTFGRSTPAAPEAIKPISVEDRYPTPSDCAPNGLIWVYDPVLFVISLGWLEPTPDSQRSHTLRSVSYSSGRPVTHWIPAHCLHLQGVDGECIP